MKMKYNFLLLSICLLVGCEEKSSRLPSGHLFAQFLSDVGKNISVQGILRHDFDVKPYLETKRGHLWLDNVQISSEQNGKIIKAWGIVRKHSDLPIVTNPKDHGILLPKGATIDEAKIRFSLSNASYK
ncbi:MAG: hypothetical protein COA79_22660 [Planctomycetota bacterium]|nr:MAG: hypothetical protein COA79_22660 [Planctomycetota bacterium]